MANMVVPVKTTIEKINSMINWNYIGLAAAILSIAVTVRNITVYIEQLNKNKGRK